MKKTLLIRNVAPELHAAAKTVAAHLGVSLNKFIIDAIRARCLMIAQREGIGEKLLRRMEAAAAESHPRRSR